MPKLNFKHNKTTNKIHIWINEALIAGEGDSKFMSYQNAVKLDEREFEEFVRFGRYGFRKDVQLDLFKEAV